MFQSKFLIYFQHVVIFENKIAVKISHVVIQIANHMGKMDEKREIVKNLDQNL